VIWRRLVLCCVILGYGVTGAVAADSWRCLLKRTALAEGKLTSTLYVIDPVAGEVKSLATFNDFDIRAAAADPSGKIVLAAGYPYGVPAKTVRIYRVDVASGDYTVLSDFDYPQLPEVAVAYEETEGVFYVAAWGKMDRYRRPDGLPIYATFIYRFDPASSEVTPFNAYDRELALVGAGGGALYVTGSGHVGRGFDWGITFGSLDVDSGEFNKTDFLVDAGPSDEENGDDPVAAEGLWGEVSQERLWFTGPARYQGEVVRQRPIYYYSLDLFNFIGDRIDVYVDDPADSTGYRMLEVDWRALDISYSYLRDAAVYLLRGHGGKPTEVAVTYGDGTPGPRLTLPAYELRQPINIAEIYRLSFDYSLLYVE
jgi:hypothetical protein